MRKWLGFIKGKATGWAVMCEGSPGVLHFPQTLHIVPLTEGTYVYNMTPPQSHLVDSGIESCPKQA